MNRNLGVENEKKSRQEERYPKGRGLSKTRRALLLISFFTVGVAATVALSSFKSFPVVEVLLRPVAEDKKEKEKIKLERPVISEETAIIEVVEKTSPAVVSIVENTVKFDSPPENKPEGIGTGFVIEPGDIVLTNSHVVSDNETSYLILTKNGEEFSVKKITRDPFNDLAILEIDGNNLPTLTLGDSDKIRVGQSVVAIGNALGRFSNTVTTGVVSGIGRGVQAVGGEKGVETLENVIQTDAALNPGNSGGPLLDLSGEVIGINSAVTTGAENIGFAIPTNTVKAAVESYRQTGRIIRPFLGVRYQMITQDMAKIRSFPHGAFIQEVVPDSAAQTAGFKPGDIIVKMDGFEIDEKNPLGTAISKKKVGDEATFEVDREGKRLELKTTLKEAPTE